MRFLADPSSSKVHFGQDYEYTLELSRLPFCNYNLNNMHKVAQSVFT